MELSIIMPHIEALIFTSEKPLTTLEIVDLVNNALGFIEHRASLDQVEAAITAINEKFQSEFFSFEIVQSGGGWQFLTKKPFHKTVALLNGEKFLKKLSTAALETLSIIAYKQPVTKGEMEIIRGVNCDYAVSKLLEKDLIVITGRKEDAPGQPLLYGTSKSFMDYFGINSTDELPKLEDILVNNNVEPTVVQGDLPLMEAAVSINDIMPDAEVVYVNEEGAIITEEATDTDVESAEDNVDEVQTEDNNNINNDNTEDKPEDEKKPDE